MLLSKIFAKRPLGARIFVFLLVPVFCLLSILFWSLGHSVAVTDGKIEMDYIKSEVVISRDKNSIPTITAKSDMDAYAALGFVHAQDRLWQMEMARRIGSGRLSEVLGRKSLNSDKLMKTLGFYRRAEGMLPMLGEKYLEILNAYTAGVNEGIEALSVLPPEYQLLMFSPEKWTRIDTLVSLQLMNWKLSSNLGAELVRGALIRNFGVKRTNYLMPEVEETGLIGKNRGASMVSSVISEFGDFVLPKSFLGSNSWVLSGDYTKTGKVILASDPHLQNSIPSSWYVVEIKSKDLKVSGATLPGLPFVSIGKNEDIAWGVTSMMADTQDVALEKINPLNRNQYMIDGEYLDMEIYREKISIKKQFLKPKKEPVEILIRETNSGPLLSDVLGEIEGYAFSVKWVGDKELEGTFESMIDLNYAKNWDEFSSALKKYVSPASNFMYGDIQGNIGYIGAGKIPNRKNRTGAVAHRGWNSDELWSGWIPFEEMPKSYNPEEGYVLTANNRVTSDDFDYYVTSDWAPGYRAKKIEEEIRKMVSETGGNVEVRHMESLQGNVDSYLYRNVIKEFVSDLEGSLAGSEVLDAINSWDGKMDRESIGATIAMSWISHFSRNIVEDELNSVGVASDAKRSLEHIVEIENQPFIEKVLRDDKNIWCDIVSTIHQESCKDIIFKSFNLAVEELTEKYGDDIEGWRWGDVHVSHFAHFPFSKSEFSPDKSMYEGVITKFVGEFFHRSIETPGSGGTINVAPVSFQRDKKYFQFFGAGYRQVAYVGRDSPFNISQSTGQSGNPMSRHYDDLLEEHADLQYVSIGNNGLSGTLVLSPM